jgi:hypothetical protein
MSALPPELELELGSWAQGLRVLDGPTRVGNERRWSISLADGQTAVLAQLTEELAGDDAVRRRYRRDVEQLADAEHAGLVPMLAWGPVDDGSPPWRLRLEPAGESLADWLDARAPVAADELARVLAPLCDQLALLHALGFVVRNLSPTKIVLSSAGPVLVDIGLARVDILSTRTAVSLVLEGSPYTAPELLLRTAVDGRADLYALGVLAFRALTGQLPFGDVHALLRPAGTPHPREIVPSIPADIDALVVGLLDTEPSKRPRSAALVADVLRGEAQLSTDTLALRSAGCQSCGAAMPLGQRLCTACGRLAVQYRHAGSELSPRDRVKLELRKVKEDAAFMDALQQLCDELCDGSVPALNFMIGDGRMYSKAERARRIPLPCVLFTDLDRETAERIQQRFAARGIALHIVSLDAFDRGEGRPTLSRRERWVIGVGGGAMGLGMLALMSAGGAALFVAPAMAIFMVVLVAVIVFGKHKRSRKQLERWGRSLMQLRAGPAALPASDPLVARLAALIQAKPAADVAELVGELALLIQRLVDHRAANLGESAEIDMATEPVRELIELVERRVTQIVEIDAELAQLDEGKLVRALAAAKARAEPSQTSARLLDGLDRLRELESRRAQSFSALLAAGDLVRRSVELGLRVHDPEAEHERCVRAALLALGA